jgi:maleylacetoacetate isomerase/maleylpyruvate isomerase
MELYGYFRSSASYRVRIALALKGLAWDSHPVHLLRNEQQADAYAALSTTRLVPLLRDGDVSLHQSLAIIEYLDETHPRPPLLPPDAAGRARVRALALDVACEIHPLNNLRVLRYLLHELKLDDAAKDEWARHWTATGLQAVERQLALHPATGRFCHGDAPTLADIALVPQVFNARRVECPLEAFPTVMRVFDACMQLPAFDDMQPSKCPDAA